MTTIQELWDKKNEMEVISDEFLSKFAQHKANWLIEMFDSSPPVVPNSRGDYFQQLLNWRDSDMNSCKTYQCLRQTLDQYSVFAGRNVLVRELANSLFIYESYSYYITPYRS